MATKREDPSGPSHGAPRIDVVHMRDPDSECSLEVYLNGVRVTHETWDFDPGRGYEIGEADEDHRAMLETAPPFLRARLAEIYREMSPTYERWAL